MFKKPSPRTSYALPRRGLHRDEAAIYVGVSITTFDGLVAKGIMPKPIRLGGRVLWDLRALDLAFDELSHPEEPDTYADFDESLSVVRNERRRTP